MIPSFWFRWLQVATIGIILYGAGLIVMPGLTLDFFSLIFFGKTGGFQAQYPTAIDYIRFIHGDLGSIIFGWGVTCYMILNGPFRRVEPGGWEMLALPLAAWFVTASAHSVYTGYWQNIIFNIVFLSLYTIPLAATRKYFNKKS
ncbi:MAG: hypothetical protein HGB15_09165 [Chlorobaculum sp.]|jgi:hypothetical protein|nr:hypothetical protein [Chlorobaculum sp.]